MKVLVTGASGNIGSHAVPELLRQGHSVRCFTRDTPEGRRHARALPRGAEAAFGDVLDPDALRRAAAGVDAVVHLAAVIPPGSEEDPEHAREVNVEGTRNAVAACRAQPRRPRLLFASTFDVHGHTLARPPPRRITDPLVATDGYTAAKIEAEGIVRASGLEWCIFRLSDVPVLGIRDPHPIMFEIGLHNRIEALHADDAALAVANALGTPEAWGRVLFVGGGPSCQLTYGEYLRRLLEAMGIDMLPAEAFAAKEYATDWIDTEESQRLLRYQRHGFDDIAEAIAASLGWKRHLLPLARSAAHAAMLKLSPYWRKAGR